MEEKDINLEEQELTTDDMAEGNPTDEVAEEKSDNKEEQDESVDPLKAAEAQIADLKDKYLRQVAEFDNYRKRTLKERAELRRYGTSNSQW